MMRTTRSQFIFFTAFLIILSLVSTSLSEKCLKNDKTALLKIKNALNNPSGLNVWQPSTDCCEWKGIRCDDRTNGVINIEVSEVDCGLLPIPATELSGLPRLESLTFYKTNLSGPIPQTLTKLKNLGLLDLGSNQLTGPVPEFLTQFKNLYYIRLSSNRLTGSIPASLAQIPKLSGILLDDNQLTGSIPESFGEFKAQSINIFLSNNKLSGKIPKSFGNPDFRYVDLSYNKLEGDISFAYGRNKTITSIILSRNKLEFDFSNFEFPKELTNLYLDHNKIYGSLPKDLINLDELESFDVSHNRLCGKIPPMSMLFDTKAFSHNKCLCGSPLPDCKKKL